MERERGGRAGRRALPGARHGAADPARGDVPRGLCGTGPLIRPPAAATFPKGEGFGARYFRGALRSGRILNPPLRLRGEKLTATARTARNARKEKQIKSVNHPSYPPHHLCGSRVFRPPGKVAGTTGLSRPAKPIRTTPVLRQSAPGRGVLPPSGFLLTGRGRFLLSKQKKMGAGSPGNLLSPARSAGPAVSLLVRPPEQTRFTFRPFPHMMGGEEECLWSTI